VIIQTKSKGETCTNVKNANTLILACLELLFCLNFRWMIIFYPVVLYVVIWGLLSTPDCLLLNISTLWLLKPICQTLRCFLSRDALILIRAFNVYVWPIVECCSPVWSPTAVGQINKIKSVQRWFTKWIKSLSNLTHDERLIKLRNDRLELRRLRADLLICYKILHHHVD